MVTRFQPDVVFPGFHVGRGVEQMESALERSYSTRVKKSVLVLHNTNKTAQKKIRTIQRKEPEKNCSNYAVFSLLPNWTRIFYLHNADKKKLHNWRNPA